MTQSLCRENKRRAPRCFGVGRTEQDKTLIGRRPFPDYLAAALLDFFEPPNMPRHLDKPLARIQGVPNIVVSEAI